jgi:hypothetical protein
MKKNLFLPFALAMLAFTATSCEKDINSINKTNPNQFTDSDPVLMMTGAEMANVLVSEGEAARLSGLFAGHFIGADRQFISYSQYKMTAGDFNTPWGNLYTEGIAQCRLVRAKALKANNMKLFGVANITEANLLLAASGLWGDVPDAQACDDNIDNPKYDKMSDVTKHCIALLDSAIPHISGSNAYSVAYAGTFDWAEVANTMKARAYLRLKDYAKAKTAATAGVSKGNDMFANHSTETPGAWNLYYDFLDWNRGGYIGCDGSHIASLLDTASAKCRNNAKTDEMGRFNHYFIMDYYTHIDPNMVDGIFKTTSNFTLASYVENELILAECEQRLGDNTAALSHLNNARADLEATFTGYQPYVFEDFGPSALISGATASDALLKEILTEKYVSLFGQLEPFCDVRRTNNLIGIVPTFGTDLPKRFLYPQDEINTNSKTPSGATLFTPLELFQ